MKTILVFFESQFLIVSFPRRQWCRIYSVETYAFVRLNLSVCVCLAECCEIVINAVAIT